MRLAIACTLAALLACDAPRPAPDAASKDPTPVSTPVTPAQDLEKPRTPPPAPADMPALHACQVDTDCAIIDISGPDPASPCCDATLNGYPVTRAYLDWVVGFRARECASVTCPDLPIPGARMTDCGYEPRCKQGTCGNACGEPSVAVPPPPTTPPPT